MNLLDKHEGIGQGKLSKRRKLLKYGAPGEIRTPDQLVRSQLLYPAELRALCVWKTRILAKF